jgi:hypothetical protein
MSEPRYRARCACGWEALGSEAEVVVATMDHARRIHNMEATPEQVLAGAERLAEADAPGA